MRFLLNVGKNHWFDQRMLDGLGDALWDLGHEAYVVNIPQEKRTAEIYDKADVIVEINHPRDDFVPLDAIHIAWIQDYILEEYKVSYDDCCLPHDIIYTFGYGPLIGAPTHTWKHYRGSLLTGVDKELLNRPPTKQYVDFSIVGFIPPPLHEWLPEKDDYPPEDGKLTKADVVLCLVDAMRRYYKPMRCHLDPNAAMERLKRGLQEMVLARKIENQRPGAFEELWEHTKTHAGEFIQEYARLCDRRTIARLILSVSENTEFRGRNWERWPEFADWAKPYTDNVEKLLKTYQRSKINVHNNPSGFSMHHRVLESMAVGGFVMSHTSPHGTLAGQITESFVPDVHFGEYTVESFHDRASYWLENTKAREDVCMSARKVIRTKHLWSDRATQILRDLSIR